MTNKNLVNIFFIGWLYLLSSIPLTGQAQILKEFAAVDSLKVGDTFDFSITLEKKQEYEDITFPDSSKFGPVFEIRSKKKFKLSEYKDSVYYRMQFFGTADTLIPKLPVQLVQGQDTSVIYTKPVPIRFNSLLSDDNDSFRPLKPIFEFARSWWPYLLGLLLLTAFGYYGYQYYRRNRQKEKQPKERPEFTPEPFVNPLKEFKSKIRKLENVKLETQEDYKAFYSTLGDAIRQYYKSLYNLPALESTSRELLIMLKNGAIDDDLINGTRSVLQEADMVKFAKFNPTPEQAERALEKAYNFLKRARDIDGPRIEHKRREHQSKVEAQRQKFHKQHENGDEVE